MEKQVIRPPEFVAPGQPDKWIVRPEYRQNQDDWRIEVWMPYRGALPTSLCRYYGLVYDEQGNTVARLPLKAETIEAAFRLFPEAFKKYVADFEAAKAAVVKATQDKADAIKRAAEKEAAKNGERSETPTGDTPQPIQNAG